MANRLRGIQDQRDVEVRDLQRDDTLLWNPDIGKFINGVASVVTPDLGVESIITEWLVRDTPAETPYRYPLDGRVGTIYKVGADWWTETGSGFQLDQGSYLILYEGGFGDILQLGGGVWAILTNGIRTSFTGEEGSEIVGYPWSLVLTMIGPTTETTTPYCYSATPAPVGPTYMAITIFRLTSRLYEFVPEFIP